MDGITMDGIHYRVRIIFDSLKRSFELLSGPNAGNMLTGRKERDLLGTGFSYQLEVAPDPRFPGDYDAFYDAISSPVESHTIIMPYGQTTIQYDAAIKSGQDLYHGQIGGVNRWRKLTVKYEYIEPQKEAV